MLVVLAKANELTFILLNGLKSVSIDRKISVICENIGVICV